MKPCQVDGCVEEDIFTLPEVLVQDTHITPSENTRSSEGTDSGTPFGTSSQGPFLSSPPSAKSETLPSAACCDLTDVIGTPLRRIKAGIGIFGIIGGIKNVGTQALISNPFKVIDRASKSLIKIAPKFGERPEDLPSEILNKGKLFKDLRTKNFGNISVIIKRDDGRGFLRATFDPDGKTLKSGGYIKLNKFPKLIEKGDLVPLE